MKGTISLGTLAMLLFMCFLAGVAHAQVVKYVHTDALGSVVAISDSAGQVTERREYEPYGSQLTPVIQNGPGYTGHVQDAETGLTYMQQRYYDPDLGKFASVDPVTAYGGAMGHFNRYAYTFNNPYKFTDPDGRAPCTGTKIGNCVNGVSFAGLSSSQLRSIQKDPVSYLNRLNDIPNSQSSEGRSSKYFSRTASPVTAVTGLEVGADIAFTGSGNKPFSVVNYKLGDEGGVTVGNPYTGPGARVAIAHTHPRNTNFSGAGNGVWDNGWRGSFARGVSGDLGQALNARVNAYVALPDGGILRFDFRKMNSDTAKGEPLNATNYIERLP